VNWRAEAKRVLNFVQRRAFPLGAALTFFGTVYLILAYYVLNFWTYVPHYELSWAEQLNEYLLFKARSQWEYLLLALSVFCVSIGIILLLFRCSRAHYKIREVKVDK